MTGSRTDTAKLEALTLDLTKRIEREFYYDQPGGAVQTRSKVQSILSDALTRILSVSRPEVKGLEWRDDGRRGDYRLFVADTAVGKFVYGTDRHGTSYHHDPLGSEDHKSEADARQTAEAVHIGIVLQKAKELGILSSLSPPTGGWQTIETADKSIAVDMQFPGVPRMLHSYPIWVRADGGKPFEASWVQRHADRPDGYWWDWDAEDVVDPDEWMPHPLQPLPSPPEAGA